MTADDLIALPATFSPCRQYRYSLRRDIGGPGAPVLFVMLNPSTADEQTDDPTIRRCMGFATRWGAGVLYIANLFALRATDPRVMLSDPFPVGPENDAAIRMLSKCVQREAGLIVAAWGAYGQHMMRGRSVAEMIERQGCSLNHLGLTKAGHPRHPLYLRADMEPQRWEKA